MASRLKLHQELLTLTRNVYFQPPESIKISYPCILYTRDTYDTKYADNGKYLFKKGYKVTIIDTDPEKKLSDELYMKFPHCKLDRSYTSDNLYHDVFTIFY